MALFKEVKVLYGLSRAGTVSLCKGVHREVKSEGSKWQNLAVTNRNLIVGHYNLGNLAIDRIAQRLDGKCVVINQVWLKERTMSYLGRSYCLSR
ncbi:hypothetical protein BEI67_17110 [Photobacterium damselae subsp. piscicida]|nr:hypothetical protein BEI67_17110 [Photobacterium damselae subsp. piscicida]